MRGTGRDAARRVGGCGRRRALLPAEVLQPELLSEVVAVQVGLQGAEVGVGVGQGSDLGYGELRGP